MKVCQQHCLGRILQPFQLLLVLLQQILQINFFKGNKDVGDFPSFPEMTIECWLKRTANSWQTYLEYILKKHKLTSESCKSLCLASISVRYEDPTQFWHLPPFTPPLQPVGWGKSGALLEDNILFGGLIMVDNEEIVDHIVVTKFKDDLSLFLCMRWIIHVVLRNS